jgi:hypothetical protein
MGRVRGAAEDGGIIRKCVDRFIQRFESEKIHALKLMPNAAKIDVLDLTYRLMIDTVTGYLFNKTYDALDGQPVSSTQPVAPSAPAKMSALPFIFAIVKAGRFSLLPPPPQDSTYQFRLLATGISTPETIAQCMAVTFAGTDSPAVKLVTIIFHLVRNPAIHARLRSELRGLGRIPPQTRKR